MKEDTQDKASSYCLKLLSSLLCILKTTHTIYLGVMSGFLSTCTQVSPLTKSYTAPSFVSLLLDPHPTCLIITSL